MKGWPFFLFFFNRAFQPIKIDWRERWDWWKSTSSLFLVLRDFLALQLKCIRNVISLISVAHLYVRGLCVRVQVCFKKACEITIAELIRRLIH